MGLTPPPPARRDDTADVVHGVTVPDPYRWLEDADSADTRAWVTASNERTRAALDDRPGRDALVRRYTELFSAGAAGAPSIRGGRLFSIDRWGDLEQAVLVVRDVHGDRVPAARTLVDPHDLTGDPTASIDWYSPSVDGRLVAFGTSTGGDERSTLRVVDVATGELRPDTIPHTRAAAVAWLPDGSAFAYTRYPDPAAVGDEEANYNRTVWWHVLGDDPGHDELVFGDLPDRTAWPSVELSRDGRWLIVELSLGWTRVDVHLIDRTTGARTTVIEGVEAVSSFTVVDDRLVGTTTLDAPRGRVVTAPLASPTPEHWATVVPESEDVVEGMAVTRSSLLVTSTRSALSRLTRLPRTAAAAAADSAPPAPDLTEIALPEPGSLAGVAGDRDSETAVVAFTSWARPTELWRWAPAGATGAGGGDDEGLVRWSDLPSPVDPAGYAVGAERYPSTDGTEITLFTLRRADVTPGPSTPTVLSGYGGFAVTMSPAYSPSAVAVADEGGVYAVACIRGGVRGRRGLAPGRHARAQAAGVRRLRGRRRLAGGRAPHGPRPPGGAGRQQRRAAGGRHAHPAARRLPGGRVRGAADRHGAVPPLPHRPAVDPRVRRPRGRRRVRLAVGLLAVPPPGRGHVLPRHAGADGRGGQPGRSRPRPQVRRRARPGPRAAATTRPVLVRVESRAGHGQGKPASKQAEEAADVHTFLRWQIGLGHD